ncbi:MAG: hypothetical protein AABZ53_00410 [Planctomycetota bacterium]
MTHLGFIGKFAALTVMATVSPVGAQPVYFNSLDSVGAAGVAGPSGLLAAGWAFPHFFDAGLSHNFWQQGPWHAGQPAAWEGTGYLTAGISVPPFGTRAYSQWMISPALAGQSAGQIISTHVRGFTSGFPIAGSIQLRYSPSGGIATGSTTSSVGDFTVVLDTNSNGSLTAWDELQGLLPGNGRVAIRWSGTINGGFSGTALDFEVDEVSLDGDSNTPRVPQPGETVHWTTAMSPIHLVNQQVIPRDGTLIIDAGVAIDFDFNTPLFTGPEILVAGGTLRFEGTAGTPVVLRRGVNTTQVPSIGVGSNQLITVGNAGSITADHVDSDVSIGAGQSAILTIRDSAFSRQAPIDWFSDTDVLYQVPRVGARYATVVLENCSFHNAIAEFDDTIFKVSGCDFDNSRLNVVRFPIAQTATIDGNTFRNSPVVAPLELDGYDTRIGADNAFTNNFAAVSLRGGGLTPDSSIPATGNTSNRVYFTGSLQALDIVGPMTLPPMSVPYRLWAGFTEGQQFDPRVRCLPGTTIEMDPGTYLSFQGGARFEVLGSPEAPVRFVQAVPGQPWLTFQTSNNPPLIIRNAVFDGGELAVGGVDTLFSLHDCTITNSGEGVRSGDYCGVNIGKTRFINNGIAAHAIWGGSQGPGAEGVVYEYGAQNENAFEGNGQGVVVEAPYLNPSSMQNAWWDSPSGPTAPGNPGGTGQSASFAVDVTPFRTAPVDFDDHPPVVRVKQVAYQRRLRPGTKIILHWDARDDGPIVSQRLENLPVYGFRDPVTVIPDIPPDARSVELTITPDGQASQVYRIVTVDNAGQEGFDDYHLTIGEDQALDINFLTDLSGGYRVGENFDVELSITSTIEAQLHIDDLPHDMQPMGSAGLVHDFNTMPAVSTDLARYVVLWLGEPHYSPYFSIRPQVGFGDEPPQVSMTSPAAGSTHAGGTIIPILWTASDDHGLRSFDLHASYDAGESWHAFALDLPGTTRAYNWQLPASTGIADVRVRVIARDSRFQVTSDGTHRVVSVLSGDWPQECPADFDADGTVDFFDYDAFVTCFEGGACPDGKSADFDADGTIDFFDYDAFVVTFEAGC